MDFDELEWFVSHENITAYKDHENDWILEVLTPCKNLKNNLCAIYEDRPNVCRGYDPENCTHNSEQIPTKILLKTREDVQKLAAKRFKKKAKKKVAAKATAAAPKKAAKKTAGAKKKVGGAKKKK